MNARSHTTIPAAEIVAVRGKFIRIHCPYCHGFHEHEVQVPGRTERRSPGCGMERSEADRLAGYTFTTPRRDT